MKLQNHPGPSPGHHAPPLGEPRRGARPPPPSPSGAPATPRAGSAGAGSTWALFTAMAPRVRGELGVSRAPHAAAPAAAIFSLARTSRAGRRDALRLRTAPPGRGGAGRARLCACARGGRRRLAVAAQARWRAGRGRGGPEEGARRRGADAASLRGRSGAARGGKAGEAAEKLRFQPLGIVRGGGVAVRWARAEGSPPSPERVAGGGWWRTAGAAAVRAVPSWVTWARCAAGLR